MNEKKTGSYGWLIFGIFFFGAFVYQYTQYQLSVLAPEVIAKLGLSSTQFSSVFSAPMILAIFFSLLIGIISDKIGMKMVIAFALLVSLVGGIWHIFAGTYSAMFTAMILVGLGATALNVTCGKMFSSWMKPERIAPAMGAFLAASTVGQFVAQLTTVLLGSLSTALFLSGILCCAVFVLWIIFGRDKQKSANDPVFEAPSIGETLKVVFSSRSMWLIAIALFLTLGCQVAFNIWIPAALTGKGLTPAQAGAVASIVSLGNLCGSFFIPSLVAKIGKDKPFILLFALICAVGYAFAWRLDGAACYVAFFIFGVCASSLMVFFISMPLKLKEIGPRYAGTAVGLIATIELLGAVVFPTYISLPLASGTNGIDFGRYFVVIGIFWVGTFIISIFLPETGAGRKKIAE